jgi:hypothetical protein
MFKIVYVKASFILTCRKDGKTLSGFMVSYHLTVFRPHEIELQKSSKMLTQEYF